MFTSIDLMYRLMPLLDFLSVFSFITVLLLGSHLLLYYCIIASNSFDPLALPYIHAGQLQEGVRYCKARRVLWILIPTFAKF